MSSLLVTESDFIPIAVYYTVTKNRFGAKFVKVLDEKKAKALLADPTTADKVQTLNTKWRQQTWSAQQQLFANSNQYHPETGKSDTDWTMFSDQQLKSCLVDWDLADDDGRPYPVSGELIDQLHASIANEMLLQYRKAIMLDDASVGE